MKKTLLTLVIISTIFLTSCASHHGIPKGFNQNSTEVVLSKRNFNVVKFVKGDAKATYVFGIGGLSRQGLIAEAKSKMLQGAGLEGSSRTIINETVEVKKTGIIIVSKYEVIVSGLVIEFTE